MEKKKKAIKILFIFFLSKLSLIPVLVFLAGSHDNVHDQAKNVKTHI